MNPNDNILELKIDSLTYEGAGIAKHAGKAVFIDETVDGDLIKAEVFFDKKDYAKAKLVEIIEPSSHRIKPLCAIAKACGGCQWQHIDYKHQLDAKKKIVEETVKRISGIEIPVKDVIQSPKTQEYRCKIQLPISQTKVSKRLLSGYYKKGTHEITNIKFCPIQPQVINEITEFVKEEAQKLGISAYREKTHTGLLRHFVFRYSSSKQKVLLTFVINSDSVPEELSDLSNIVINEFDCITGILANFNTKKNNVILGKDFSLIQGKDYIEEELQGRKFKISKGSFFQVNPEAAVNIFQTVENIIKEKFMDKKVRILDAYSGVGSFSIWVKDLASEVVAVEEYPQAVEDAKANLKLNNIDNITLLAGEAQGVLEELNANNEKFDVVIIDPPRKGCSEQALDAVSELSGNYIIYVSCNPATLARDIKYLNQKGFIPEFIQPVDMFCHTYHIESIVSFRKK